MLRSWLSYHNADVKLKVNIKEARGEVGEFNRTFDNTDLGSHIGKLPFRDHFFVVG